MNNLSREFPSYMDTWSQRTALAFRPTLRQKFKLALPNPNASVWQNVQTLLGKKTKAQLIGTLDPKDLARGVDISHWNGDVDLDRMHREGAISYTFAKGSDGKQVLKGDYSNFENYKDDWFDRNVQKAYLTGIPCFPYHFPQWDGAYFYGYTVDGMVKHNWNAIQMAMKNKIPKKSYHGYVLDVEAMGPEHTDPNGSDVVLGIINRIKNDPLMSQVPLIIYSSMAVLNFYTKLREQISNPKVVADGLYWMWMAQWVYNVGTSVSWNELVNTIYPKISCKVLTPGYQTWKFFQWTSSVTVPGCTNKSDLNVYNGSEAKLFNELGFVPTDVTPPPPPDPENPPTGDFVTHAEFDHHTHVTSVPTLS